MHQDRTSMVGLKIGHIHENLTQNGESRDIAGNAEDEEEKQKKTLPPRLYKPFYHFSAYANSVKSSSLYQTILSAVIYHLSSYNVLETLSTVRIVGGFPYMFCLKDMSKISVPLDLYSGNEKKKEI